MSRSGSLPAKNTMMEKIEEQGLNDVPKFEVLDINFECEGQENGSGKYSQERMLQNFREIVPCPGQCYFQQTQKGRMRMVAMDLVPEYLKVEGWPGRWLEERGGSYGKSPGAKNRFDFSVLSNF